MDRQPVSKPNWRKKMTAFYTVTSVHDFVIAESYIMFIP